MEAVAAPAFYLQPTGAEPTPVGRGGQVLGAGVESGGGPPPFCLTYRRSLMAELKQTAQPSSCPPRGASGVPPQGAHLGRQE